MDLVLDANILFAALIKDSYTSELLFNENLNLYAPDFIISEFWKYEDLILRKTCRTKEEFVGIMHSLKEVITTIPAEEITKFMVEARSISPDDKDSFYFALSLKLMCGIWSNDKRLKAQETVKVYSTADVVGMIKEK